MRKNRKVRLETRERVRSTAFNLYAVKKCSAGVRLRFRNSTSDSSIDSRFVCGHPMSKYLLGFLYTIQNVKVARDRQNLNLQQSVINDDKFNCNFKKRTVNYKCSLTVFDDLCPKSSRFCYKLAQANYERIPEHNKQIKGITS